MSGGGGGGGGGGVFNLSNVEEGRGIRSSPDQSESATRPEPTANEVVAAGTRVLGACMFGLPWRRIAASVAYMTTMLCAISLVVAGALDWAFIGWGVFGSVVFFGCCWFARLIHTYTTAGNARRRGRQRIPRGALEARLQLHHPGIELGRLRLLLVDRDFTGEDYQALLDLDENNDVPSTVGASEGEIRRNPSFLVRESSPDSVVKPKNCSICLYPFKAKERVRIIPCLHQFHTDCIDPWLRQNAICPVCKFPAVG